MNDKMKAKCYRLDYNELGLSTLCVEKDKEIKRLKEEYIMLQNASDEVEEEKDKEIERLNNIINGMEKFFQYAYDNEVRPLNDRKVSVWTICLDKLKELKGSDKE